MLLLFSALVKRQFSFQIVHFLSFRISYFIFRIFSLGLLFFNLFPLPVSFIQRQKWLTDFTDLTD